MISRGSECPGLDGVQNRYCPGVTESSGRDGEGLSVLASVPPSIPVASLWHTPETCSAGEEEQQPWDVPGGPCDFKPQPPGLLGGWAQGYSGVPCR